MLGISSTLNVVQTLKTMFKGNGTDQPFSFHIWENFLELLPSGLYLSCCCSVSMSDSSWSHAQQHDRLPCPLPSPGACSNSWPLSQWCHPISATLLFSICLVYSQFIGFGLAVLHCFVYISIFNLCKFNYHFCTCHTHKHTPSSFHICYLEKLTPQHSHHHLTAEENETEHRNSPAQGHKTQSS